MDPGDAGRIFFVLGLIWSSPSSPPSSPSASPPPAAVDASAPLSPSTSSPPAAVDASAPISPSTSSPPAAVDPSAPISPSTSSPPAATVAPLSSSSTSPLPDPPSSSSTSPPPATAPFRLGWCYLLGRLFNFAWRVSGPPPTPPSGPTSAPSLAVTRNLIRRRCQALGGRSKNVYPEEEIGVTTRAIEVAEERQKVSQKEMERGERERIAEKRKQKKKRNMDARARRSEERAKEEEAVRSEERAKEEEAVRRAKDSDEASKAQLIDARRKAEEAQIADERRKTVLAAVKREVELAAASKGKMAQGSRSAPRMPRGEAKNYARRATAPFQYRMYTDGMTFKDVVLRTVTGKQQEDEMTQLEEMAEPVSQSEEELKRSKRSEVAARRMAITDGKRPLLSPDGINAMPSEKPLSTTSPNLDNQIYEENQQPTQEDKKKPREEVARAEEDELEFWRDVLFMLGAEEWNMWYSPDVGDALRSIFCPLNGPSTLQKQLSYDSDNASTESSSAQEEGSSETK